MKKDIIQLYLKNTCKLNKMMGFVKNKFIICGLSTSIYFFGLYKIIKMGDKQNYKFTENYANYFVPF